MLYYKHNNGGQMIQIKDKVHILPYYDVREDDFAMMKLECSDWEVTFIGKDKVAVQKDFSSLYSRSEVLPRSWITKDEDLLDEFLKHHYGNKKNISLRDIEIRQHKDKMYEERMIEPEFQLGDIVFYCSNYKIGMGIVQSITDKCLNLAATKQKSGKANYKRVRKYLADKIN
jgi:hypothetical protein